MKNEVVHRHELFLQVRLSILAFEVPLNVIVRYPALFYRVRGDSIPTETISNQIYLCGLVMHEYTPLVLDVTSGNSYLPLLAQTLI